MKLLNRLGLARLLRRGDETDPAVADDAIFLNGNEAARGNGRGLKPPRVRTIHRVPKPAAVPAKDTPYPDRTQSEPPSLLDRLGLSRKERHIADELFGTPPMPALRPAAPPPAPAPAPATAPTRKMAAVPPTPTPQTKPEPPRPEKHPLSVATAATPKPVSLVKPKRKKMDRGDLTLGALGLTLALICALFPWYIFFNQEKFGVREFVFEGGRAGTPPSSAAYQPQRVGKPFRTGEVPRMELDLFPTATLPSADDMPRAVPVSEQPFPADLVTYRLVHVANGRAMIQDGDGLWVVQRGSRLPDASQVAAIEQREGGWVLITTRDKVIRLGE